MSSTHINFGFVSEAHDPINLMSIEQLAYVGNHLLE